jgi:hypothetical protein
MMFFSTGSAVIGVVWRVAGSLPRTAGKLRSVNVGNRPVAVVRTTDRHPALVAGYRGIVLRILIW